MESKSVMGSVPPAHSSLSHNSWKQKSFWKKKKKKSYSTNLD